MLARILSCLLHILFFCALSVMAGDVDLLISFKNSLPNPNMLSNWNRTHGVLPISRHNMQRRPRVLSDNSRAASQSRFQFSLNSHSLSSKPKISDFPFHKSHWVYLSPHKLYSATRELDLSSNDLKGSVSDAASLADSCPSLQLLNLSDKSFGPAFYSSSPAHPLLKILDLSYNKISTNGDLQWLPSKLISLKHLDLSNNDIQGTIPHITNCTSLQHLDLSANQLFGTIPAGTFSGCLNLTYLNLSSNHFTNKAPADIKACSSLVTLSLSNNNFSGEISVLPLVALQRLGLLDLAFNNFHGSLPKSISKLANLEILDLSANQFSDLIPQSLCT